MVSWSAIQEWLVEHQVEFDVVLIVLLILNLFV